jgi:hypothetical protein
VTTEAGARPAAAVRLAAVGTAGVALSVLLVTALHVIVGPARVNPLRRTISEYAFSEFDWLFNAGVLALAAGSAAVLVALVRTGLVPAASTAAALLATWCAALVLVVAFEKIDWSVGPSLGGYIHRYAGLLAFTSLPAAALLVARRWRGDLRERRYATTTWWLALASLAWLLPIIGWFVLRSTGVRVPVPLGLMERGLALTEVAAVLALGWWATRASRR